MGKTTHASCTTEWKKGQVTSQNLENNVSIDRMPQHILDIITVITPSSIDSSLNDSEEDGGYKYDDEVLMVSYFN